MRAFLADTASWTALGVSAAALLVSIVIGVFNARTARRALAISEAEHQAHENERAARGELRMNMDVINMDFDPALSAYVTEGSLAVVRLRIEIQNTGGRSAGPGSMEIDVPSAIHGDGMRWSDAAGGELAEAPERAAHIGPHHVLHRTLDLIGRDVGKTVFVTLPTPVPDEGVADYPIRVRVGAEGAGPVVGASYVLRIRRREPHDL